MWGLPGGNLICPLNKWTQKQYGEPANEHAYTICAGQGNGGDYTMRVGQDRW